MGQGGAQRTGRPIISGEALRKAAAKKAQQEKATPAEKPKEKAPVEKAKEKAPVKKAKGKRVLQDRSPPLPPTRLRLASSSEMPSGSRGASGSVGASAQMTSLGGVYVPQWNIREGSSVATPEVANELFEGSCLIRDLEH